MSYVVYDKETTKLISNLVGGPDTKYYATERAAKAARTRYTKANPAVVYDLQIADTTVFYETIEKDVVVKSLMTGEPVTIKANTPWCCNPASETYWSM